MEPTSAQENTAQRQKISNQNLNTIFSQENPDPAILLDALINESIYLKASDILLEPRRSHILARVRIDGVLYEVSKISPVIYLKVSTRIKVLCNLDITKKKRVQEGQVTANHQNREVNLRVEIAETVLGELIVIRIHEKETIVMELAELGFSEQAYDDYQSMIAQRSGLILACGPTGCGKTTTLYSSINKINEDRNFNVMTVEDPVEFKLEGFNQMQTHEERAFTFAEGLKTILRLSPDIILVGEIRDSETAEIAVESGLTGQLVLSTIHSEDSIGALFRLLDLGIEPYLINSSLMGIVAQRLVRKNCPACLEYYKPTQEEQDLFSNICNYNPEKLVRSRGCSECQNMAFKGRVGIFEVLRMRSNVRDLIRRKVNETDLRNELINAGMTLLLKDGLDKVAKGITTVEEVLRNSLRID
jgi:type II secretory ATPase GspE/PulE/Tfp pilus assembly ATPase PilB-like protein